MVKKINKCKESLFKKSGKVKLLFLFLLIDHKLQVAFPMRMLMKNWKHCDCKKKKNNNT